MHDIDEVCNRTLVCRNVENIYVAIVKRRHGLFRKEERESIKGLIAQPMCLAGFLFRYTSAAPDAKNQRAAQVIARSQNHLLFKKKQNLFRKSIWRASDCAPESRQTGELKEISSRITARQSSPQQKKSVFPRS
jgi:hypothetical protein